MGNGIKNKLILVQKIFKIYAYTAFSNYTFFHELFEDAL